MEIINSRILVKYIKKNKGNSRLSKKINELIETIETSSWSSDKEIKKIRPDADRVHTNGCYFFDIHLDRTLILIEFNKESAMILWCGSHQDYERTFRNNKKTIKKWLIERKIIDK